MFTEQRAVPFGGVTDMPSFLSQAVLNSYLPNSTKVSQHCRGAGSVYQERISCKNNDAGGEKPCTVDRTLQVSIVTFTVFVVISVACVIQKTSQVCIQASDDCAWLFIACSFNKTVQVRACS